MKTTIRNSIATAFTVTAILWPLSAFSWGLTGHEIVAEVGARLTENGSSFWRANQSSMAHLATVPDSFWKRTKYREPERPNHWFEPDGYFPNARDFVKIPLFYSEMVDKYGEAKVREGGTAPWRIRQLMLLSIESLEKYNYKKVLQMAGTMSHYVGDLSQPLHVTTNYDGQLTDQKGVHKYFETTMIDGMDRGTLEEKVEKRAQELLQDKRFLADFKGPIEEWTMNEVARAHKYKDDVLREDKVSNRENNKGTAAMRNLAVERLADGAATLAMVLNRIWEQGGDSSYDDKLTVPDPEWVENEFKESSLQNSSVQDFDDDCYH